MTLESNTPKYIFIVPYRNREPHLYFFQKYITYLLEDYEPTNYEVVIVNQNDKRPFNRGAMKNIGFLYVKEKYPITYKSCILIFNDIDTLPYKKGLLNYDVPVHTIKHFYGYKFALGGIFSIRGEDFESINGFPNYWGWGFEDNEIHKRALVHKMTIDRSVFFPIQSMQILQFFDGVIRNIDKNILETQFKKNFTENDGINLLKNCRYKYNQETNMLDVDWFESKYNHNNINPMNYNLNSGSKITKSSLYPKKKLPLLFL